MPDRPGELPWHHPLVLTRVPWPVRLGPRHDIRPARPGLRRAGPARSSTPDSRSIDRRYGAVRERSISLIVRTLRPDRSASSSCVSPAATRRLRTSSPKPPGAPAALTSPCPIWHKPRLSPYCWRLCHGGRPVGLGIDIQGPALAHGGPATPGSGLCHPRIETQVVAGFLGKLTHRLLRLPRMVPPDRGGHPLMLAHGCGRAPSSPHAATTGRPRFPDELFLRWQRLAGGQIAARDPPAQRVHDPSELAAQRGRHGPGHAAARSPGAA